MEYIEEIVKLFDGGENFVLATVFNSKGSAPRAAGARMLIHRDGSSLGTVGGGLLEGRVVAAAVDIFATCQSRVMEFLLTGADAAQTEMICGGQVEVLVEYCAAEDNSQAGIFRRAVEALARRQRAWMVTEIPSNAENSTLPARYLVRSGENTIFKDGFPDIASFRFPTLVPYAGERYLVEPVCDFGTVFIFGGGHISQKLAPLARLVGFRVVVLDDRPEFVEPTRFPQADGCILVGSFEHALEEITVDPDSYLVIVTRGHLHDKTVLAQALHSEAAYIGMIGSRRKRDAIYTELATQGFSPADFKRVFSPIGLPIEAETPEEIAVSIMAELIQVRAGRKG